MSTLPVTSTSLALAVELDGTGAHPASWYFGDLAPSDGPSIIDLVRRVERAGFALATFADPATRGEHPTIRGRLDPVEVVAFAAAATDAIGLVPAVGAIHAEPFHLANQLASADFASYGRAGWIAEATDSPVRAHAYGSVQVTDPDALHREADEVIAAVRRLWDTWEDGVAIADAATGHFLDPQRLHYADIGGGLFAVKGPSITPRPPQGQLVVFAPFGTVSPHLADVHLVDAPTALETGARADAAHLASEGREHRVFAEVEVVLDSEHGSATQRLAELDGRTPWPLGDRLRYVGSTDGLIGLLEDLIGRVDGVRLHPAVLATDLFLLEHTVLPELRRKRRLVVPHPDSSLRRTLGLTRPVSVFAQSGHESFLIGARHDQ
ncbi:LLM class flavin-dependent oxidoreductase [Rhodococcus artemisiae]|uniref:LLM class flavin-dependent oxidoreductase n=1 Tax=Rhodococcus artemisiae TaxID=714159 RepID=A0ABU7L9R0_9NOCA|nr:LLM class flavin-dependent oxidoreductase [Rhodococcus artemisiae]MEE2058283.1 LLM class flavin-dependent oxidoreductase [Rhodococcus artemisiae]